MEEVPLVILNPKLIQHLQVLFCETHSLMMLLLIFDVPVDCIHLRMAVGKTSTEASGPFKPVRQKPTFIDPFWGFRLYRFHNIWNTQRRFEAEKAVYMVFHPIHDKSFTAGFVDQVSKDSQKIGLPLGKDDGFSIFDRKDGLDIHLMIRVCHKVIGCLIDWWFYTYEPWIQNSLQIFCLQREIGRAWRHFLC